MRIVIVEDEPKTRTGLVNLIHKYTPHTVVGVAENGYDGKLLINSTNPDLVITDVSMPKLDGISMLLQLKEEDIKFNAIILSGYSDFEYARKAIKAGVCDYLLKPITVDDLQNCISNIEKNISNSKDNNLTIEQQLAYLFSLQPELQIQNINNLKNLLKIDGNSYTLFLFKPVNNNSNLHIIEIIKKKLDTLNIENFYIAVIPPTYEILLLINNNKKEVTYFKDIVKSHVLSEITAYINVICACEILTNIEKIIDVVEELKSIMLYSITFDENIIITKELINDASFIPLKYPIEIENKIKSSICKKKFDEVLKHSENFKDVVLRNCYEPSSIIEAFARLSTAVCTVIKECGENLDKKMIYKDMLKVIVGSISKYELINAFNTVIKECSNDNSEDLKTTNYLILKTVGYIRQNYMYDITLTQTAQILGVTPEYLSILFNKEVGVPFSLFIKKFRISHAKRLLLSGKYNVQETSQAVGFNDPKYFNRVFKEICGISPSEFKKMQLT